MLGDFVRADFEHAEVALFVGKNPWMSHGFPHARTTLKEIARDPDRAMIVIDPRRTETAELADYPPRRCKPGTDAWLVGAMAADPASTRGWSIGPWLAEHATGLDDVAVGAGRDPDRVSGARSAVSTRPRAGGGPPHRRRRERGCRSRTSASR